MTKVENIYEHPDYLSLKDFPGEEWRHIPGARPEYFVSSLGRVKSLEKSVWNGRVYFTMSERILKATLVRGYYQSAPYCGKKKMLCKAIHQSVALAFIGPPPSPKHQVNHMDGVKWNNRPKNLEWTTSSQNAQHAHDMGLAKNDIGVADSQSQPVAQLTLDGKLIAVYGSQKEAGRLSGVRQGNINHAIRSNRATAGGFRWLRITTEQYMIEKGLLSPVKL